MTEKAFSNELDRALNRPDIDQLRTAVANYYAWHDAQLHKDGTVQVQAIIDPIIHDCTDTDRSLALVVIAMAEYDDPKCLALVAAGPLEDLLSAKPHPSEALLARILDEARKTPRFRWILSGVWTTSLKSDQAMAVKRAVGKVDLNRDTLPPRPWP